MASCPLWKRSLASLCCFRDSGPSEIRAPDRDSQLSWYCIAIGFPCCLTPAPPSCKGDQTSHSQDFGPSCHCPQSQEHVKKMPSPGSGLRRTSWDKAPLRVHGCPLVAARGIELQGPRLLPFGEGLPIHDCPRSVVSVPGQLGTLPSATEQGEGVVWITRARPLEKMNVPQPY